MDLLNQIFITQILIKYEVPAELRLLGNLSLGYTPIFSNSKLADKTGTVSLRLRHAELASLR